MENTLAFKPDSRPEEIERILTSLDRYNPENIKVLQDYVTQQSQGGSNQTDVAANLALLKLYQFNYVPGNTRDEYIVMILTKALVRFYSSDFTTCMHLLPAHVTSAETSAESSSLKDQVDKLVELYKILDACKFSEFWAKFESDDSYLDLVADVNGFEDDLRLSISNTIKISYKQIQSSVFQEWVNIPDNAKFKNWVEQTLGWNFVKDGQSVQVPLNKENDPKPIITAETVRMEQVGRLIKHAFELTV